VLPKHLLYLEIPKMKIKAAANKTFTGVFKGIAICIRHFFTPRYPMNSQNASGFNPGICGPFLLRYVVKKGDGEAKQPLCASSASSLYV
jgi:hypothetical protein